MMAQQIKMCTNSHKTRVVFCKLLKIKQPLSIFKMFMSRPKKKYQWVGQGVATLSSRGCIKNWWLSFSVVFICLYSTRISQHLKYQRSLNTETLSSIFYTSLTLKSRNALVFGFTSPTHGYFFCRSRIYNLKMLRVYFKF